MPQAAAIAPFPVADRLFPPEDAGRVDDVLDRFLTGAEKRFVGDRRLGPLFDSLRAFVLRGGKRVRPRLCLASYRIISGQAGPPPECVWRAAASLELFHAFMLVHDDLIDGSVLRRDRPTLHEALRLDSAVPDDLATARRSRDLALLGGDLLFALGMRMLNRSGLDAAVSVSVTRRAADMLLETGLGEALDVLQDDGPLDRLRESQIVDSYVKKTARYTVSGPMVMGATIAGASPRTLRAIERFGDRLGFAYQVRNDLEALDADPVLGDHPDLDTGKRTYLLWATHRRLDTSGRLALAEALAAEPGADRRCRLISLMESSGAVDECRKLTGAVRREAVAALRRSSLDPFRRRAYVALAQMFQPDADEASELVTAGVGIESRSAGAM